MNGDHQSVATAPLDLRTTNRERGCAAGCEGRARDAEGVTGGSPATPACTGTDTLETHRGSEAGAARKRPADKPSSKLPFRKRQFVVEPETQRQAPAPPLSADRFPPPDFTARERFESRVGAAPVTPRRVEEAGQGPDGYPVRFLHPFDYGKCCWFSVLQHEPIIKKTLIRIKSLLHFKVLL